MGRSLGEELVTLQQTRSLELVYCIVDHLLFVHDAQGKKADGAHAEQKNAEEEEEAEHVNVPLGTIRVPDV